MKISLRCTQSAASSTDFDYELIETLPGYISFRIGKQKAYDLFKDEAGGHRVQRIPPTEKKGRVQTSTITVAVLPEPAPYEFNLNLKDLDIKTCRGSGAGGQHRNKTDSAVQITHIPTGTTVRCESERSQTQNKETALKALTAKLWQAGDTKATETRATDRKAQVGSGMRGDKRRTIRFQDDYVVDHETGKTWTIKEYTKGNW